MDPTGYAAPALAGAGLAGRFAEAEEVQLTPEQLRQPRTLGYVQWGAGGRCPDPNCYAASLSRQAAQSMQVFISHPHEYESQAADVAAKLRVQSHSVFLDRDSLPPGDTFDDRIRAAVAACDLFIFFIGPDSLARGRYTLTELGYAKERWKNPRGRVLPVMVGDTDIERVDPYLRSISILRTTGDFATEVANRAAEMLRAGRASASRLLGAWIRGWISTVASSVLGAVLGFLAGGFAGERLIGGQPEDFKYVILAGIVVGGTTGLLASRYWQRRASSSR